MRYSNLHTHTTFSDGAHSAEENVLSAIGKNMVNLGFSDHSYTDFDPSYCMLPDRFDTYHRTIAELKEKYAGQIQIFKGIELDYYSKVDPAEFDYLIASVHYIIRGGVWYPVDHSEEDQRRCIEQGFGGDVIAMAQCYFEMLCEHVERWKPTLVGHFDVITKFGLMPEENERYRKIAREALQRIIRTCPYVEVNTGAISRKKRTVPYPCPYLWDTLRECGGEPVLGSDSHHKENLIFYFDETVALLRQAGFDRICVFNGKDYDRVTI